MLIDVAAMLVIFYQIGFPLVHSFRRHWILCFPHFHLQEKIPVHATTCNYPLDPDHPF